MDCQGEMKKGSLIWQLCLSSLGTLNMIYTESEWNAEGEKREKEVLNGMQNPEGLYVFGFILAFVTSMAIPHHCEHLFPGPMPAEQKIKIVL